MTPEPQPFNRISFITLNQKRLFTAEQVADLIEEYSSIISAEKVLEELVVRIPAMQEEALKISEKFVDPEGKKYWLGVERGYKEVLNEIAELRQQQGER